MSLSMRGVISQSLLKTQLKRNYAIVCSKRYFQNGQKKFSQLNGPPIPDLILEEPYQSPKLRLVKIGVIMVIGISVGACLSKILAAFLEENEVFVPDDDDDDDDD